MASETLNGIVVELRKARTPAQRDAIYARIEGMGIGFANAVRAQFEKTTFEGEQVRPKPRHAGPPGSGPLGETCGSCSNYERAENVRRPRGKCLLTRHLWAEGPLSDIQPDDLACRHWERHAGAPR